MTPSSVDELIAEIARVRHRLGVSKRGRAWYRGCPSEEHALLPSLLRRDNGAKYEGELMATFMNEARGLSRRNTRPPGTIEVKSGVRTRARRPRSYIDRYGPRRAVKLAGSAGGTDGVVETWPLYDAAFLAQL